MRQLAKRQTQIFWTHKTTDLEPRKVVHGRRDGRETVTGKAKNEME